MKKVILFVLAICLSFAAVSCGADVPAVTGSEGTIESTSADTEAPVYAEESDEDVFIQRVDADESECGWRYEEWTRHIEISLQNMPYDNSGVLEIPSEIKGKPVTHIMWHDYDYLNTDWDVDKLIIPDTVTSIGEYASDDLSPVNEIVIPNGLWDVGQNLFKGTAWYKGLTDEYCIVGDSLLIKYNGDSTNIVIPEGVKHVGSAFINSGVVSISFPSTLESIGASAFHGNWTLKSVTIPGNVKIIGNAAFSSCGLTELTIEEGVTEIKNYAFKDNDLTSVTLPASLDDLWGLVFSKNYNLESVTFLGNPSYVNLDGLEDVTIRVPEGSALAERLDKSNIAYEIF